LRVFPFACPLLLCDVFFDNCAGSLRATLYFAFSFFPPLEKALRSPPFFWWPSSLARFLFFAGLFFEGLLQRIVPRPFPCLLIFPKLASKNLSISFLLPLYSRLPSFGPLGYERNNITPPSPLFGLESGRSLPRPLYGSNHLFSCNRFSSALYVPQPARSQGHPGAGARSFGLEFFTTFLCGVWGCFVVPRFAPSPLLSPFLRVPTPFA